MQVEKLLLEQLPVASRRLRVAMVTETYPPEINGVAMTIGRIVGGLQARDHQIQLIRPRQGNEPPPSSHAGLEQVLRPGIPIPRYTGLNMGLPAKRVLSKLWGLRRPDVVHIATEGPLGWSAMSAASRLRLPVLAGFHTNFHTYSTHYGFGWLKNPIHAYLRKFHNRADRTLVPTLAMKRDLSRLGYRNVEVLARGVDPHLFSPARRDATLRRNWGVGDSGLAVVYVGRLAPEKNLALLIRAFEAIKRIRPDARLVLVGDGPEAPGLRTRFPDFVCCGPRVGEDLARHYASADLFLFPSLTETFGNVLIEAMASGLAVLGFDYAAAAEHVVHCETGLTAPFGAEAEFIRQAEWLATRPETVRLLGRRAREAAEAISWETIVDQLEDFYQRVVREREMAQDSALHGLGLR